MKKIENNFAVSGFVGNNAEIRQFATSSVAPYHHQPLIIRGYMEKPQLMLRPNTRQCAFENAFNQQKAS